MKTTRPHRHPAPRTAPTARRANLSWLAMPILALLLQTAQAAVPSADDLRLVEEIGGHFLFGRHEKAGEYFAPSLAARLPLDKLKETRNALEKRFGPVVLVEAARAVPTPDDKPLEAVLPVDFKRLKLDLEFRWTGTLTKGALERMSIMPRRTATQPGAENPLRAMFFDADYVDADRIEEREVTIPSGAFSLPGLLTLPLARQGVALPAVLLVGDREGPDADGTIGPNRPLRDIAGALATRGIVTLSWNRRPIVYPDSFLSIYTIEEELIEDALAAARFLAVQPEVDRRRIVLLGLGQGATCLPEILKRQPGPAALVLLSPAPAWSLELVYTDLIARATAGMDTYGVDTDDLSRLLVHYRANQLTDIDNLVDAPVLYWRGADAMRPIPLLEKYKGAAIILLGETDYLSDETSRAAWRALDRRSDTLSLRQFPGLNRWLMKSRGGGSPLERDQPGHVAPEVIDAITDFVRRAAPAPTPSAQERTGPRGIGQRRDPLP